MERLVRTFKALADPTRLRIVNLLLLAPGCVCELQMVLDLPQSLISRHLAHLRNAGVVDDKRQGMRVQYELRPESLAGPLLRRCLAEMLVADEGLQQEAETWRNFRRGSAYAAAQVVAGEAAAVQEVSHGNQSSALQLQRALPFVQG